MAARSIWKGSISFGLVTIPVGLFSAEDRSAEIGFHMLDKRNMSPVKQKRVNEQTGQEVPWDDVVKGYEYEEGRFVVLTPEEIKAANPLATQTIDIVAVVDRDSIEPAFFDKPYYIAPEKAGRKAYALLREVLRRKDQVAIAKVVIRTKQYLAAVIPEDSVLLLDLLRYAYELRSPAEIDVPSNDLAEVGVSEKEVELADQLVGALVAEWDPEQYQDTYHNDLIAIIKQKAEAGGGPIPLPEAPEKPAEVIDIMALLKKSVEAAESERGKAGGDGGKKLAKASSAKEEREVVGAGKGSRGRKQA